MSTMFRASVALALLTSTLALPGRAVDTDVVINEAFYLGDGDEDWVELKNTGPDTIDVGSWWICSRLLYMQLSTLPLLDGADLILGPGEIVTVGAGMNINDVSADLGLYRTSAFGDPNAMIDFLQWGTSDLVGRSSVAAMKTAWREELPGVYDSVATASASESVAYCGANSGVASGENGDSSLLTLSEDFGNGISTRGAENGFPCSLIFADGFESGDASGWTGAFPLGEGSLLDWIASK